MTCMVTLPVAVADSAVFAPVALVGSGNVTLYAKRILEDNFTIPTITFFASGEE